MSFEIVTDRYGDTWRPFSYTNEEGQTQRRVCVIPHKWGGRRNSGIYVDYGSDDQTQTPATYSIVMAIPHDSPLCVLNTPREAGGIMPGDLIFHERHVLTGFSWVDLEIPEEDLEPDDPRMGWLKLGAGLMKIAYPLCLIHEDEVQCRVDGILPDPWTQALENLTRDEGELVLP